MLLQYTQYSPPQHSLELKALAGQVEGLGMQPMLQTPQEVQSFGRAAASQPPSRSAFAAKAEPVPDVPGLPAPVCLAPYAQLGDRLGWLRLQPKHGAECSSAAHGELGDNRADWACKCSAAWDRVQMRLACCEQLGERSVQGGLPS